MNEDKQQEEMQNPIGIFDSGIGGLTVVQSLRRHLPQETLCYFGDTARVPYGTKSSETVQRYSVEITRFLRSHDAKILVIACNTVSSVAMDVIRNHFNGPVLGVVEPGVRAAIEATKTGRVGVIGTRSTIRSGAYQQRLLETDPSLHIAACACPLLVPFVEEGWEGDPTMFDVARKYLEPLIEENLDVLILGCTHYPLISNVIQRVMGDSVTLVSSAEEVAKETKNLLVDLNLLAPEKKWKDLFYASDDIASFKHLYERIFSDQDATFMEAQTDFFTIVQDVYRFKGKIFADKIEWFEAIQR